MSTFRYTTINETESLVSVPCRQCKQLRVFNVNTEGLKRWIQGELIQRVLPELSPSQRELLISNTCNDCWQKMFPPEPDV